MEDQFRKVLKSGRVPGPSTEKARPFHLVHSGALYPSERDPEPFFWALRRLQEMGQIGPGDLRVILRATGHDSRYAERLEAMGIDELVELAPGLPYGQALEEMINADGLLLFQAANCNHQIPAKLYEYLRARRPILALTDAQGDTAAVLGEVGIDTIVPLDDSEAIERGLMAFLKALKKGNAPVAELDEVQRYSRRAGAAKLAGLFDRLVSRSKQTRLAIQPGPGGSEKRGGSH